MARFPEWSRTFFMHQAYKFTFRKLITNEAINAIPAEKLNATGAPKFFHSQPARLLAMSIAKPVAI
jgi:uncharacterized membrane protein